jgi:hypothetical protein
MTIPQPTVDSMTFFPFSKTECVYQQNRSKRRATLALETLPMLVITLREIREPGCSVLDNVLRQPTNPPGTGYR